MMTLSLTFLFSVIGLSVDLGYSYSLKVSAQAAADSAAAAAAVFANSNGYGCTVNVTCNTTYTCPNNLTTADNALKAGCLYAAKNGFKTVGSQTVTMSANNTAVPNEPGNSPALWIQANVTQNVSHLFLFWNGATGGSVSTMAISGVTVTPDSGCVYVLDTGNTQDALLVSGTSAVMASGCGIFVNSSNPKAMEVQGSTVTVSAPVIHVHGGYNVSGHPTITPTPSTNAAVVTDPFLTLPAPSFSGCSGTTAITPYSTSVSATIDPGVYCGGIAVSGGTLTLNPGNYILNGGGLVLTGQGQLSGSNVMFYLTGQGGHSPGPLSLQGGSDVRLTAPNGGTYQGILFFQDRNVSYAAQNIVSGNTTFTGSGAFYFPSTTLLFAGTSAASTKMAFVVKDLTVTGNAGFTQDTSGIFTGLGKRSPGLIQ